MFGSALENGFWTPRPPPQPPIQFIHDNNFTATKYLFRVDVKKRNFLG